MINCSSTKYFYIEENISSEVLDKLISKLNLKKNVMRLSHIHFAKKADAEKFAELVLHEQVQQIFAYILPGVDTLDYDVLKKFEEFTINKDVFILSDNSIDRQYQDCLDFFYQEWDGEELTTRVDGDNVFIERKVKSKIKTKVKGYIRQEVDGKISYKAVEADYTNEWFTSNPWQYYITVRQGYHNLYEYR